MALCMHSAAVTAQTAAEPAPAAAEGARRTAFVEGEGPAELAFRLQLATRLGLAQGADGFDGLCGEAALQARPWRRASVACMKASSERAALPAQSQANYDPTGQERERERADRACRARTCLPPFHSFLCSVHSQRPDFLVNTHVVNDAEDLRNHAARVRALPVVLDTAKALPRVRARTRRWPACMTPAASRGTRRGRSGGAAPGFPGRRPAAASACMKIIERRRRKAERELGNPFDLEAFHESWVPSGAQPRAILERRVDEWIAARRVS